MARIKDSTHRDSRGYKECSECRTFHPETRYTRNKTTKDGLQGTCSECQYYKAIKYKYGWSRDSMEIGSLIQGNKCDICGSSEPLVVDHDHTCCSGKVTCGRCVRSMICSNCNRGLGYFRDSPETMRAAASYVEQHRIDRELEEEFADVWDD